MRFGSTVQRPRRGAMRVALTAGALVIALPFVPTSLLTPAGAATVHCASPGRDGDVTGLTGVVNSYYPGSGSAAAGTASISLGAATGATTPIAVGDLLLVIQMQDATIDADNSSAYGANDGSARGATALNSSGKYEYVTATSAVPVGGGTLSFTGTGTGAGLNNTYTTAAPTATDGQRTFQVVRVPQYASATVGAGLTAGTWNGSTGGVLAIDVASNLGLGANTVSVAGEGFRGGGGRALAGGTGSGTDYVTLSTVNTNGAKAEGIAGVPRFTFDPATTSVIDNGVEGLPNGSQARGAPGNAGAGGTDANPGSNDQNSGGGGGANGGIGGQGGNSWSSNQPVGGFGGAAFTPGAGQVILGGGGGAGTRNNSDTVASSGTSGGGVVLFRVGTTSGAGASINADGLAAYNLTANDGGGGGGAGGSIGVTGTGSLNGFGISAVGGRGGDAWATQSGTDARHGPGGGGAGGAAVLSALTPTVTVTGGVNGITTTANDAYGATPGDPGVTVTTTPGSIPGTSSGAECGPIAVNDVTSTNAGTPVVVNVLANDTSPEGYPLTVTSTTPPGPGATATVTNAGANVTYTPPTGFTGYDTFTYTISDGHGGTATATVQVFVGSPGLPQNDKMTRIGIGGTVPGTGPGTYDQSVVNGALVLATQQLVLSTRNGFVPVPGQTYDIVTATSVSGAYASIAGQVQPNGVFLDVQYLPTKVRVVAMNGIGVDSTADVADANPGDGICATAAKVCTLRAAVQTANATAGADAIMLKPSATYTRSIAGAGEDAAATGDLDLTGTTSILGQNAKIDANNLDRALHLLGGSSLNATKLTVTKGDTTATVTRGGGIENQGTLTASDLVVTANTGSLGGGGIATEAGASTTLVRGSLTANVGSTGGGLYTAGTTSLDTVTVSGNTAGSFGGGLEAAAGGSLTVAGSLVTSNNASVGAGLSSATGSTASISKTTFSSNSAAVSAGGVDSEGTVGLTDARVTANTAPSGAGLGNTGALTLLRVTVDTNIASGSAGGIVNGGTLTINTSTVSGNQAPSAAAIRQTGGSTSVVSTTITANKVTSPGSAAVSNVGGTMTFFNSINAANTPAAPSALSCAGTIGSTGYNLSSDASCTGFTATGDAQSTAPSLGALASNGGYAPTHVPAAGAAVNTGPATCGTGTDQRLWARPRGTACDKGSVEK